MAPWHPRRALLTLVERGLHAELMLADAPDPLLEALSAFFDRWL